MKDFDNTLLQKKLMTGGESYIQPVFNFGPMENCYFLKKKTVHFWETKMLL